MYRNLYKKCTEIVQKSDRNCTEIGQKVIQKLYRNLYRNCNKICTKIVQKSDRNVYRNCTEILHRNLDSDTNTASLYNIIYIGQTWNIFSPPMIKMG